MFFQRLWSRWKTLILAGRPRFWSSSTTSGPLLRVFCPSLGYPRPRFEVLRHSSLSPQPLSVPTILKFFGILFCHHHPYSPPTILKFFGILFRPSTTTSIPTYFEVPRASFFTTPMYMNCYYFFFFTTTTTATLSWLLLWYIIVSEEDNIIIINYFLWYEGPDYNSYYTRARKGTYICTVHVYKWTIRLGHDLGRSGSQKWLAY